MRRSYEQDLFFEEFAYRMRRARKAKGLSQIVAAEAAGVTTFTLQRIEYGKNCYVFSALLLMEVYGMHPSDIDTLGQRIMAKRQELGKTRQELADAAGMSKNGLVRCETGATFPSVGTLFALSKVLGVDPWMFLEEHGDEHRQSN